MSEQRVVIDPQVTGLQAESLRVTAFLGPAAQLSEPTWWSDLIGKPPEIKTTRPGRGELQEAGSFEDWTLTLAIQPSRVDWYLTDHVEKGKPEGLKVAGPFPDSLNVFLPPMLRWLDMSPPIQRLAFGAVLLQPVKDRQVGYERISSYLPAIRLDPQGSSDLLYQINRPRDSTSGVTGLRINRLSRWSVAG